MSFKTKHIDRSIPVPMYFQLKNIILQKINEDELKPGELLPTETQFGDMYNLSRTTVRQAIIELVTEGYLYRVKGKGTYVAKPKILQDFMRKLESYSEQMNRLGMKARTDVLLLRMEKAKEEVADALNIRKGDNVVLLKRLRYANDEPIVVLNTYLPSICSEILEIDMEEKSLYEIMTRRNETKVVRVLRQVEAISAKKEESDYLQIPIGHPIQLTTTIGFNERGRPVEYSVAKYRGDKNKFIIELRS